MKPRVVDSHSSLMWTLLYDSQVKVYIYDMKSEEGQLQVISLSQRTRVIDQKILKSTGVFLKCENGKYVVSSYTKLRGTD